MGYTHYWYQFRPFTDKEWQSILAESKRICAKASVKLAGGMGKTGTSPEFGADCIRLNGVGAESCETFALDRSPIIRDTTEGELFFCKTREHPYDAVVVSILHTARTVVPEAIRVSSDGGDEAIKLMF